VTVRSFKQPPVSIIVFPLLLHFSLHRRPEKTPEDCSLIHQQNSRVQVEAGESGARSQGQSHVHPSSLDDERGEARNNVERIAEERARSGTEGRGTAEHLDEQVKLQT